MNQCSAINRKSKDVSRRLTAFANFPSGREFAFR
jgi:hypothetical protein